MKVFGLCLLMVLPFFLSAQKQLALVGGGRAVRNFPEGSYIHLILKDGRQVEGHIVELMEFSMIMTGDTIGFNKIRKIGIPKGERKGFTTKFGRLLVAGGLMYVGIDQFNRAFGYINTGGEERVVKISIILIATGGLLMLIKPRYQKVNDGIFLRTVDYKSPFYRSLN